MEEGAVPATPYRSRIGSSQSSLGETKQSWWVGAAFKTAWADFHSAEDLQPP